MSENKKELEVLDEGRDNTEELTSCCATGNAKR